jgi:hypothetical protein
MNTWIPRHIIAQLKTKDGRTYKSAIKFKAEDASNFVQLEYRIIRHYLKKLGFKHHRILSQTLMVNKFYRVFDLVEVEVNHDGVFRLWFDITESYGIHGCGNSLTRQSYLGY